MIEGATTGLFGKIRAYLWPIYRFELKKLMPLFFMLFFVTFNYTVLRNLKDALVITAKSSGAEVIPFIKVWVILPAAILATFLFTYLTNNYSRRNVFYLVIGSFLLFFALFTFVIYPMQGALEAEYLAGLLRSILPAGFNGFIAMVQNWPLTLFYVSAELWSTMVLTVLFWGFANEITSLNEATRFYSTLNISSNVSLVIAGQVAVWLSSNIFNPDLFFGSSAAEQMLDKLTFSLLFCGLGILACFYWMSKHVLYDPNLPQKPSQTKKEKKKMGFGQSLKYVANSNYLLCILAIVISYNLVIHMVEVIWKDNVRMLYPNPNDYNIYMNNLTSAMGIISTTAALLMAGIIRKFGWTKTALITPIVLFTTTVAFFASLLMGGNPSPFIGLAVFLGSMQNCFTKAAKYTLFDCTKEMAFIPLDPEEKLKGKAAIDGIGSRLGKSGGSLIHQGLLIIFGTLSSSTPFVAAILIGVIAVWIVAIRTLGKQFEQKKEEALQVEPIAA